MQGKGIAVARERQKYGYVNDWYCTADVLTNYSKKSMNWEKKSLPHAQGCLYFAFPDSVDPCNVRCTLSEAPKNNANCKAAHSCLRVTCSSDFVSNLSLVIAAIATRFPSYLRSHDVFVP